MTALTLFQIAQEHRALADQLQDMDLPAEVIADTLAAESSLVEKSQAVAFVIRNLESVADAIEDEAKRMADRAKAARNRADAIKRYLHEGMQMAGVQKIEHPQFTLAIRKNPASVQIDGVDLIPAEFMRQPEAPPPVPDKKAIAAFLKIGVEVPGASLVQTERLDIR